MKNCIVILIFMCLGSYQLKAMFFFGLEEESVKEEQTQEEQIRTAHDYEILRRRAKSICYAGVKCAVVAGASNYLMSNPNFLMFAGLIGMGFRDKIEGSITSFQKSLWPTDESKELENLELELKLNQKIPKNRAQQIRDRIAEFQIILNDNHHNEKGDFKKRIDALKKVVALPTKCKQLPDGNYCKEIEDAMKSTYDQKLVEDMKLLVFGIVERSKSEGGSKTKPTYLFIGGPGTGKTATAELIASCLGLPFFKINLAEHEPESLCMRRQTPSSNNAPQEAKITECFLSGKALNCVFFFDEAHDVLRSSNHKSARYQSVLKNLLTSESYFDEGLQTDVYTQDAIFIFAANKKLDDTAGALQNRMDCFEFRPAGLEARTIIANKFRDMAIKQYQATNDSISVNDAVYKNIIEYDAKHCPDEGVRALQRVIEKYVLFSIALKKNVISSKEFNVEAEFAIALGKAADKYN